MEPSRTGPRADNGKRFVAFVIDFVILLVVQLLLGVILGAAGRALSILVGLGYSIYFEGSPAGQTPGKRAMGIRVVDFDSGGSLGFGKAAIRYLGKIVSGIACLLGFLWILWDPQRQGWHDKIARTVVVPVESYPVTSWP